LRLALSILLVFLSGCSLVKPHSGPVLYTPAGVRPEAIRATAVVTLDSDKKVKGRAYITAKHPEAFRVEVLSPFGTPAAVMMSNGESLSVVNNGAIQTYHWSDASLPYAFTSAELVSALLGRPPSAGAGASRDGALVTSVTDMPPSVLYNVTEDTSGNVTEVVKSRDGLELLVIRYSDFREVGTSVLPHNISIREARWSLEVLYKDVTVDPELTEDLFRLKNGDLR